MSDHGAKYETHRLDQLKENYDFLIESGSSHEGAAQRLGMEPEELKGHLAALERRRKRAS